MPVGRSGGGEFGQEVGGPPWILGHRGAPHEAPENTLSGLRRALELSLDGFEYDLRACATGEAVLMHDESLNRTTDASGPLRARSLPELFGIDAGAWFGRDFEGEPLPLFEEALELVGDAERPDPFHMIELKEGGMVEAIAARLREVRPQRSVRVASFLREVVLEARTAGLPSMLLAERASEVDRRFVQAEGIDAYGTGPGGWRSEAGQEDWSCERWSWSVDSPEDLLEACRMPLFGFNTNEPRRALATRALVRLAPRDEGPYPVQVPFLEVAPEGLGAETRARGEWFGSWKIEAHLRNPFSFPVRVACDLFLQGGAFEVEGLPASFDLGVGEERAVSLNVLGGSHSPGADPLFAASYSWRSGPGRPLGRLILDAPLARVRCAHVGTESERLFLLKEHQDDPQASVGLRVRGSDLLLAIENPGDLSQPHLVARLDGEFARGGGGLRLRLPDDFTLRKGGVPFSVGIEGQRDNRPALRRWAGGIPEGIFSGFSGRLLPTSHFR